MRLLRTETKLHQLTNIGTCGLHIIHGSFKTGIKVTDWNIKAIAKSAFQILHHSPARRTNYISVSRSNILPLFFCATRWVEDKKVAEQLLEIWPHISEVVAFWLKLPKSKQPKCKSFKSVKEAVEDELTTVKLSFFQLFSINFSTFFSQNAKLRHQWFHLCILILWSLSDVWCRLLWSMTEMAVCQAKIFERFIWTKKMFSRKRRNLSEILLLKINGRYCREGTLLKRKLLPIFSTMCCCQLFLL